MEHSRRVELFNSVRNRYASFLEVILWRLTGNRELFLEALQYSLLEIWRHVEKLHRKNSRAYIYRILQTAVSKAWRNRVGKDGKICQSQVAIEYNPEEKVCETELVDLVRQTISQLPTRQNRAIVMRYLEEKDYNSIAEQLCCSEATVRSHVCKAIATLKNRLLALTE